MSRKVSASLALGVLLIALVPQARAQITFSNYLETRVGKDPDDPFPNVPDSRFTRFDQFNLDYYRDNLNLGFRFEGYVPSDDRALEFSKFTHRYAGWTSDGVDARIGNYQALFGRGVVLRAFELTGVVREEVGTPQFGDSRDLDGIKLRLHRSGHELILLNGKPRAADEPPTAERRGSVTGVLGTTEIVDGVRVGVEYVRLDAPGSPEFGTAARTSEVPGGFVQVGFDRWLRRAGIERLFLDSYVEYARATGLTLPRAASSSKVDPDEGRALYLSQSLFVADILPGVQVGVSWEYKDYQNFEFGVNEPPQLVREHTYALLNRTTHVVEARQEEGYQFESRLNFRHHADLTLNWSRAENRDSKQFKEFYAELAGLYRGAKVSVFAGDSDDGIESLFDRETFGTYALVPVYGPHSIELEYEQMTGIRSSSLGDEDFKDNYVSLTYSWAGLFSLTMVRQTTDDPMDAGQPDPVTGAFSRRDFDSLSASVRLGNHHELLAFWGRRRGGLACTAGTCYLVRAFDGVVAQLISRF